MTSVLGMGMVTTGGAPPAPAGGASFTAAAVVTGSQYTLEVVDLIRAQNALKQWKRDQAVKAEFRAAEEVRNGAFFYMKKKKRQPAIRWSPEEEMALREGMVK